MSDAVGDTVGGAVGGPVGGPVGGAVGDTVGGAVGGPVGGPVGGAVGGAVGVDVQGGGVQGKAAPAEEVSVGGVQGGDGFGEEGPGSGAQERVLALWWPAFGLRVQGLGEDPALPMVLLDGPPPRGRVRQLNPAAAERGVRLGMRAVDAQAVDARLRAEVPDPERWAEAMHGLLRRLQETLGPAIEPAGPGLIHALLDRRARAPGAAARLASVDGVAEGIVGEQREEALPRVGIGPSLFAARAAACFLARGAGVEARVELAPQGVVEALGALPLQALPMPREARRALEALGVRTLGALARLGEAQVGARFGAAGQGWVRLARGEDPRRLRGWRPEEPVHVTRALEGELAEGEALLFVVRGMVDEACTALQGKGGLARAMTLRLQGREEETSCALVSAHPSADPGAWVALFRERIAGLRLPEAVATLALEATPQAAVAGEARSLFAVPGRSAGRLEAALARLAEECADVRVLQVGQREAHWPEARCLFTPLQAGGLPEALERPALACPEALPLALRMWRPARPLRVQEERGAPRAVQVGEHLHAVQSARGPWLLSGDWWGDAAQARVYWDVFLAGRGWWRLYRTPWPAAWYWEGILE